MTETLCPVPWMSQSLRANGDIRVCCQAQHGPTGGILRDENGKEYNARTADKGDLIIPVEISAYEDRSFSFVLKTPPASVLLAKAANISKGSSEPNKINVGEVTTDQVIEIAKIKLPDLNTQNLESAVRIIAGTANNMGISITN